MFNPATGRDQKWTEACHRWAAFLGTDNGLDTYIDLNVRFADDAVDQYIEEYPDLDPEDIRREFDFLEEEFSCAIERFDEYLHYQEEWDEVRGLLWDYYAQVFGVLPGLNQKLIADLKRYPVQTAQLVLQRIAELDPEVLRLWGTAYEHFGLRRNADGKPELIPNAPEQTAQ